jgi:glyoxylase-like metal-dependent hydrolase (beta-lactamase superfamily II)
MARYRQGELLLAPPTLAVLELLQGDLLGCRIPESWRSPQRDPAFTTGEVYGVRVFRVRSNTLPPAMHTNCFLLGDPGATQVLVDPSPANVNEYARLRDELAKHRVDEIFLTHHHPDHREYADQLARELDRPIGMSRDTRERIGQKSPGFFDGLNVKTYAEGDVVTQWLGQPVRVLEVPGHDEGQLALMPDNRGWCIVGDLIQGVGTVVIAAPEGDMAKYFATLRRVIDLAPRAIFPSHGIAAGTTYWLEETLRHRTMREEQILGKMREGRPLESIVADLYGQLDQRLQVLGHMTVQSHLAKLRAEGRLS